MVGLCESACHAALNVSAADGVYPVRHGANARSAVRQRREVIHRPKFGDGAGVAPLGKWSLEATVLGWYPGQIRHRRSVNDGTGREYSVKTESKRALPRNTIVARQ